MFNHNLETVPRLYPTIRPGARYYQSLRLLDRVKQLDPAMFTKSGLMVGLGETRAEVMQVMDDLRVAEVDFLTIGQYLQPTREARRRRPVRHAGRVRRLRARWRARKGFLLVSATPLTRSSYHADADFAALQAARAASACRDADRTPNAGCRTAPSSCSTSSPMSAAIREFLPWCVGARVRSAHRGRTGRRPDHRLRPVPRELHQPRRAATGRA